MPPKQDRMLSLPKWSASTGVQSNFQPPSRTENRVGMATASISRAPVPSPALSLAEDNSINKRPLRCREDSAYK
ncbi:hypothetical protein VTI28DRAFT_919 [Corynascus sepedonium]